MIDLNRILNKPIILEEELTHTRVAGYLRHIGIETRNKTLSQVLQVFNSFYAEFQRRAPDGRSDDRIQQDIVATYYANVEPLERCREMLLELQDWMGELLAERNINSEEEMEWEKRHRK